MTRTANLLQMPSANHLDNHATQKTEALLDRSSQRTDQIGIEQNDSQNGRL